MMKPPALWFFALACALVSGCKTPQEPPPPQRTFQGITDFQMAQLQTLGCATPVWERNGPSPRPTIDIPRQPSTRTDLLARPPVQGSAPQASSFTATKAPALSPQPKPQRITPVQKFGNTYFGPGGVTSRRVGGVMMNSDGTTGQRIGNTIINY